MKFTNKIFTLAAFSLTFGLRANDETPSNPFHALHKIINETRDYENITNAIIDEIHQPHSDFYQLEEQEEQENKDACIIELIRRILAQNVRNNIYSQYKDLERVNLQSEFSKKWEKQLKKILKIETVNQFEKELSNLIKTDVTAFYKDRIKTEDPKGDFAWVNRGEQGASVSTPQIIEKNKGNKKKYVIGAVAVLIIAAGVGYWWYNSSEEK